MRKELRSVRKEEIKAIKKVSKAFAQEKEREELTEENETMATILEAISE